MAKNDSVNLTEISRLSSSTEMKGALVSSSDIRIDGKFEGKIITEGKVVIGNTSVVTGDIIAMNAEIWGKVTGNLCIGDTLSLDDGCSVEGGFEVVRFSVELGASMNGTCRMITSEEFAEKLNAYIESRESQQP